MVFAATVTRGALVNILTATSVRVEPVASETAALIPTRGVGTRLLAARRVGAVVDVDTGLLVFIQLVTTRAGAQGPSAGVATAVGAPAVASLTAVHNLHLDPVTLPAIGAQFIACVAHTLKGSLSVEAAMSTLGQPQSTFIHIFTGFAVCSKLVTRVAATVGKAPKFLAYMHTATIAFCTRASPHTAPAILLQLVLGPALAAVLCHRELYTLVLAATVSQSAGADGQAGPAICVEPEARFALTEIRTGGVHTPVLTTTIVCSTFIHILAGFAVTLQLVAGWAAAVKATHSVTARALAAPVGTGAFVHI